MVAVSFFKLLYKRAKRHRNYVKMANLSKNLQLHSGPQTPAFDGQTNVAISSYPLSKILVARPMVMGVIKNTWISLLGKMLRLVEGYHVFECQK